MHQGREIIEFVLWKMVHFALFLVIISINFSPSFQNFSTKISKFLYNVLTNKKIAYSMRVVHSTVGILMHWLHYILIKACAISSGVVYWLSGLCSVFRCYSYMTHYICLYYTPVGLLAWLLILLPCIDPICWLR